MECRCPLVLMQTRKPNVSQTNVIYGPKAFYAGLNCQNLPNFMKPTIKPQLSDSFKLMSLTLNRRLLYDVKIKEQMWALSRLTLQGHVVGKHPCQKIPSCSGVNAL